LGSGTGTTGSRVGEARTGCPLNTHDLEISLVKYYPFIKTKKKRKGNWKLKATTIKQKRTAL
jgi:hypothetical protein